MRVACLTKHKKKSARKKPAEPQKMPVKGRSQTRCPRQGTARSKKTQNKEPTPGVRLRPPLCAPAHRRPCALGLLRAVLQEQELEAMKARLADMEKEAAKLKAMQVRGAGMPRGQGVFHGCPRRKQARGAGALAAALPCRLLHSSLFAEG